MVCVGGVPLGLVFHFWLGGYWNLVGLGLGGLLIGIPLDKFYEGRFQKLEKQGTDTVPQ